MSNMRNTTMIRTGTGTAMKMRNTTMTGTTNKPGKAIRMEPGKNNA